ncbi:MAG: FUSC family protein [Pseudonocardia sp.]|nr:FUSC family protein [Pseudonocardia sp.]
MLDYGIRMGLAAAIVYAIAAGLGLDHPGWAPAACLLVARPQLDLLQSRGVGRVLSVTVGALAAALVLRADPADYVLAIVAITVLAAASATARSR